MTLNENDLWREKSDILNLRFFKDKQQSWATGLSWTRQNVLIWIGDKPFEVSSEGVSCYQNVVDFFSPFGLFPLLVTEGILKLQVQGLNLELTLLSYSYRNTNNNNNNKNPHLISQLLLTQFWPNFKSRFLGTYRTDSSYHHDICPGNICPGDICPYQQYLRLYWPNFDQTFGTQFFEGLNFCGPKFFLSHYPPTHHYPPD